MALTLTLAKQSNKMNSIWDLTGFGSTLVLVLALGNALSVWRLNRRGILRVGAGVLEKRYEEAKDGYGKKGFVASLLHSP